MTHDSNCKGSRAFDTNLYAEYVAGSLLFDDFTMLLAFQHLGSLSSDLSHFGLSFPLTAFLAGICCIMGAFSSPFKGNLTSDGPNV